MNNDLINWLKRFNILEIDLSKLEIAFTHGSIKGLGKIVQDYERFEFLGDAVLGLVVSGRLFKNKDLDENDMTTIRSNLVKTKPLSDIFNLIDIKPYIKYVGTDLKDSIKEAIIEAFFGVIYDEKGYKKCQEVWNLIMDQTNYEEKVLEKFLNESSKIYEGISESDKQKCDKLQEYYSIIQLNTKQNAISILQDLCHKQWRSEALRPEYILVNETGPPHNPTYEFNVRADLNFKDILIIDSSFEILKDIKSVEGNGISNNKSSSKMKAAQDACSKLFLSYI